MQALQKARNLSAPSASIASKAFMSMVSMLSNSILATTPNVNMAIATVPEKVPSEKISAQMLAMISVGSVRISPRIKRMTETTALFRMMLDDARIPKGSASRHPVMEPRMDILIVSSSGPVTFGKKLQSGWKIFPRIAHIW